jgi:hypothetical protein
MVFNMGMSSIDRDREIIHRYGGPSKVAELIGLDKRGGAQRVQNWLVRGIPSSVKVEFPSIFMPELAVAQSNQPPPATQPVAQGV